MIAWDIGTKNAEILKVYLTKNKETAIHQINPQSINHIHLQVYPNPNFITIKIEGEEATQKVVILP
jgi:hypothetical protein